MVNSVVQKARKNDNVDREDFWGFFLIGKVLEMTNSNSECKFAWVHGGDCNVVYLHVKKHESMEPCLKWKVFRSCDVVDRFIKMDWISCPFIIYTWMTI